MAEVNPDATSELTDSLNEIIVFLQGVRETHWSHRLQEIQAQVQQDTKTAATALLRASSGPNSLMDLYLSGPRFGHSLSERQEIEANSKLHILRTHLMEIAAAVT